MTWHRDNLTEAEILLHRGDFAKIGVFSCGPACEGFRRTSGLDNDVFVLPRHAVQIRRNDDRFQFVEPGGILMHRAGSVLERQAVAGQGDHAWWFAVHPEIFLETLHRHGLSDTDMGAALLVPVALHLELLRIIKAAERGIVDALLLDEALTHTFELICAYKSGADVGQRSRRDATRVRRYKLVNKARACLHEQIDQPLDLGALALQVGSSPFHLSRVFRETTGIGLNRYLNRLRVGRVIDQLAHERVLSLGQLAMDSGFSSHSHMNRMIRRETGLSPSQIRASS